MLHHCDGSTFIWQSWRHFIHATQNFAKVFSHSISCVVDTSSSGYEPSLHGYDVLSMLSTLYTICVPTLQWVLQQRGEILQCMLCRVTPTNMLDYTQHCYLRYNPSGTKTYQVPQIAPCILTTFTIELYSPTSSQQ